VILVARRRKDLAALAQRITTSTGRDAAVIVADLTKSGDRAIVEEALRTDPTIEVLVNNAGTAISGDLAGSDPDAMEKVIQLNAVAPTRLTIAAATAFVARKRGTIINISSALALAPESFSAVYSATKAYLLNFSLRLSKEVASAGIRVQVVLPGATRTAIWENAGIPIETLPQEMLMEVGAVVDAALAGLDLGETVTIPSLQEVGEWAAFERLRLEMGPKLSRNTPANRYTTATVAS
jgi:uncharacterized protein